MSIRRSMSSVAGPIERQIREKLRVRFEPLFLNIANDSGKHSVPKGSETHFNVTIVSSQFSSMPLIQRHRAVQNALQEELNNGVHSLSISAKTPEQWEKNSELNATPSCAGHRKE